jgi:hypothetical protein
LCGSSDGFFASKYMISSSQTLKPITAITKAMRPTKENFPSISILSRFEIFSFY